MAGARPVLPGKSRAAAAGMTQRVQALMLAAGSSSRFGSDKRFHKLRDGRPIVLHALHNLQAAVESVVLVVKPGETHLFSESFTAGKTPKIVEATHADAGMGASLACGMSYIDGDAVLVALADMPFIRPATIQRVARALQKHPLVVPTYSGQRGHPVGFQRKYFDELAALSADEGGKIIIQSHRDCVHYLVVEDSAIVIDIDTRVDLKKQV